MQVTPILSGQKIAFCYECRHFTRIGRFGGVCGYGRLKGKLRLSDFFACEAGENKEIKEVDHREVR